MSNTDLRNTILEGIYSGFIRYNNNPPKLDNEYKILNGYIFRLVHSTPINTNKLLNHFKIVIIIILSCK